MSTPPSRKPSSRLGHSGSPSVLNCSDTPLLVVLDRQQAKAAGRPPARDIETRSSGRPVRLHLPEITSADVLHGSQDRRHRAASSSCASEVTLVRRRSARRARQRPPRSSPLASLAANVNVSPRIEFTFAGSGHSSAARANAATLSCLRQTTVERPRSRSIPSLDLATASPS